MNKSNQFRNMLAEMGMEMTPEEASKLYDMAKSIIRRSKKMSVEDMLKIMDLEVDGMSQEEKQKITELYMTAKEL